MPAEIVAMVLGAGALALTPLDPLGSAGASCTPNEVGPALSVTVRNLIDRRGVLRIELYPANDADFLADDSALLDAHKTFRRVDTRTPQTGPVELCIRAPEAGVYAVVVMHDRNGDGKFSPFLDGVGFPGDPKLRLARPKASQVQAAVGPGVSHVVVTMKYWNGLGFSARSGR
jgi:uncharacterized protein (DUF2141 family)